MDVEKRDTFDWRTSSCPHEGCPEYRAGFTSREDAPFKTVSEKTAHMKKEHNESEFPCTVAGCDRVDGKGYFRKVDLRKHMKKVHGIDRLEGDAE